MRHYEVDSPESVSRLLALTILADGGIDLAEMATSKVIWPVSLELKMPNLTE